MSVWLREVFGWLLLGVGVATFGLTYFVFLLNRRILEVGPMLFMGFIIFRGGLHLIKVASAAQALREASLGEKSPAPRRTLTLRSSPTPGQPARTVVPGLNGERRS